MSTNAELLSRRQAAIPRGIATATPIFAARALNAELWDVEGRRYIDFAGGIGALNTGHLHPKVIAAVRDQLEAYSHTAFQVVGYEPYVALAERLNALAPFRGPAKTIFLTTGAEAVENAVKIARAATGRSGIVAFTGGFHGRTAMTMALTGKVLPYKRAFGPFPGEIYHIPFPVEHYGTDVPASLKALEFLLKADIEPGRVAAIVIEPVQGEGGFHVAPPDLLRELRRICDQHGILLIADEIQSGFARTGKWFAIEHSAIEPDLVIVAKSLAGGFPLSGVIGRAEIMDAVEPGGLGGTYAGPPIACAASLAVLDVIENESLLSRSRTLGDRLFRSLRHYSECNDMHPIAHVRGLGAMVAFDMIKHRGSHEPDDVGAKRITAEALSRGLILLGCGTYGETIRILVPLTASDAVVDEGLNILGETLRTLKGIEQSANRLCEKTHRAQATPGSGT